MWHVLALCLALRLCNALLLRTTFAPDEYWQSVEVAHKMVFGYGHMTWEWAAGLRGWLHPTLFAAFFWVLKLIHFDSAWAVAKGPLLLQACFAAGTDVAVFATSRLLFGQPAARWALVCQLASWFNFYCSVRTYSNCLEAFFTSLAIYFWLRPVSASRDSRTLALASSFRQSSDLRSKTVQVETSQIAIQQAAPARGTDSIKQRSAAGRGTDGNSTVALATLALPHQHKVLVSSPQVAQRRWHQRCWLLLAALSVVVRPPSALFWAAAGLHQLAAQHGSSQRLQLVADAASIGGCCLGLAAVVDRLGYGRWVFVPWEFLRFNLLSGQSSIYGSHPWHWNFSQGFPAITATLLPLLLLGMGLSHDRRLAALAGLSLAVYSLPAHKEFRFLLPALQLAMPYCGIALDWLWQQGLPPGRSPASKGTNEGTRSPAVPLQRNTGRGACESEGQRRWGWQRAGMAAAVLALVAAVQVAMAAYFSLVQHRGLMQVPQEIRGLWELHPANTSALFLTQCHATPWYSHVHAPIPMRFMDCSPPGWAQQVADLNAREMSWLDLLEPPPCQPGKAVSSTGSAAAAEVTPCLTQQDLFQRAPARFLQEVVSLNSRLPSVIVAYDDYRLHAVLVKVGYTVHRRISNCWWQTDADTPCSLMLYVLR